MTLQIWKHRKALTGTFCKLDEGRITLGFIGGSITDARPRHNWPEPVIAWFARSFPEARIAVENAAIGATGSDLGVLRAERDLIHRGCDIVFVEYAVNDHDTPSGRRRRTREGLIRKLLADGERDVVFVYTFCQDMYEPMAAGREPDSIRELEELAEHYGIGSVWMGLHALEEVRKGAIRWEEWLPDGLHPTARGSMSYGESVIAFLEQDSSRAGDPYWVERQSAAMVKPLDPLHWGESVQLPLDEVSTEGPWTIRRWPYYGWIDRVLETAAVGAKLDFMFDGRGVALGFDFGRTSSEFRYRIDGGEWVSVERDRPDWIGNEGWYRLWVHGDDLQHEAHRFELEVIHGNRPGCQGTNFRLGMIGVIR
ncbi:SGNH/GDSL hydrolase family protein [uncultured Paenibacillus sp.]|uniref:SGNH/GDSL hydrolase family protein n=1 Tax=uncultured Paenibacillus sp. TaxID=227322 RepID=UPI0028D586B9|nr:SGNH/GDSL hydrolase family protein [uncultured Paenibacillus sp.]